MRVISKGIVDGVILDRYGKRGTQFNENGVPSLSIPIEILDAPEGTVSFALVLEDKDAIPVTKGFSWIHWSACGITKTVLEENASRKDKDLVQGLNSWTSIQGGNQSEALSCYYGGMGAPDRPHIYELHVYALDYLPVLQNGYYVNELYHAMQGHILDSYTLKGRYDN